MQVLAAELVGRELVHIGAWFLARRLKEMASCANNWPLVAERLLLGRDRATEFRPQTPTV